MKKLVFVLSAFLLASCAGMQEQRIITVPSDGGAAQCRLGDALKISLESNPTTGYCWSAKSDDCDKVVQEENRYDADPTGAGMCGRGGTQTFVFRCVNRGVARITLEYARSWEKTPIKSVEITADIK